MSLPPLAYFLTWTRHGTRLHGDPRGSVDKHHNVLETPVLPTDQRRERIMTRSLSAPPRLFSNEERSIMEETIRNHCEFRNWNLLAINVRSNHVHLVVSGANDCTPEAVMSQFKSWCTRRLRERGFAGSDERVWTEHGSTRWINSDEGLRGAIRYVKHEQ